MSIQSCSMLYTTYKYSSMYKARTSVHQRIACAPINMQSKANPGRLKPRLGDMVTLDRAWQSALMLISLCLLHLVQNSTSELVGGGVSAHVPCADGAGVLLAT